LKIQDLVSWEVWYTSDKQLDQLWRPEFFKAAIQNMCLGPF